MIEAIWGNNTRTRPWSDDEIATIKRMAAEGYSRSVIAMNLVGRSKNAVCGKLDRLGGYKRPRTQPTTRLSSNSGKVVQRRAPRIRKPKSPPKAPPLVPVLPAAEPILFWTRNMLTQCAFIAGDPKHGRAEDIQCCGAQVVTNSPWCRFHQKIVYQPEKQRDRRIDRLVWRTT